jgi:dTDP-4-dehydrorhamnose 3,5-epimerase
MKIIKTEIEGLIEIIPEKFHDSRGYFFEAYNEQKFREAGIDTVFVQDNQAFSPKGILRGMHLQLQPHSQAKLVRVLEGKVIDVAVDLRNDSPSFGKSYAIELDSRSQRMLFIPKGFAHGYLTLEDTVFFYKCSNLYHKESESGLIWNDPALNIDWGIKNPIISDKDLKLPTFEEFRRNFFI